MLGKCLWKMYCKTTDEWEVKELENKPSIESVLNAFVKAIRTVPKPRDSRQEPILEPHYKLVSIVHKLVMQGNIKPQAGVDLLQEQPYAIHKGESVTISDHEEWEPFILESLRHLRNADKPHWHHRMIARVANILFDENNPDYVQATAARQEFRESIFTKTMHIQVWKPDAERPGRHCVYMERYVRFMTKLLSIVNDKPNMELLAKRVRKKANDFFKFNSVWTDCCNAYLRLIRRAGQIPPSMDEIFKSVPHDEFEIFSERLTAWITDSRMAHPALDALRETIELKKLNANQTKVTPIDDMINDAWAVLYTQVAKTLPGPDRSTQPTPSLHQAQLDGMGDGPSPTPFAPQTQQIRNMGPMSLNNLVMDMGNGTQIPVPVTIAGHSAILDLPRARKIGISRREVLRRAELAINRVPEPPRAIAPASARPRASEPGVTVLGSNTPVPTASQHGTSTPRVDILAMSQAGSENTNAQGEKKEDGDGESSEKGSLHDSADDESDLSDVPDTDDAETEARIFPNLLRKDGNGTGSTTPVKDTEG
jgi:hypothetical protein